MLECKATEQLCLLLCLHSVQSAKRRLVVLQETSLTAAVAHVRAVPEVIKAAAIPLPLHVAVTVALARPWGIGHSVACVTRSISSFILACAFVGALLVTVSVLLGLAFGGRRMISADFFRGISSSA